MDEYEKIRQRKREEYRKRHRAQVRRKQLMNGASAFYSRYAPFFAADPADLVYATGKKNYIAQETW